MNAPHPRRPGAHRLASHLGVQACVVALSLSIPIAAADAADDTKGAEAPVVPTNNLTFLPHGGLGPLWFGAGVNSIFQYHPSFPARYDGTNSLQKNSESALSGLLTVFLAYVPFRTTELIVDPEMALGGGLSQALGVAGFPNLDVVRNPTLSHAPYIGRAEIHQLVPLSAEWETNDDRGPISSFVMLPRHRLEFRAGKLATADLFDANPVGSDSHLQFMNWTVDNNGAYDYAADTRGYTDGFLAAYAGPRFEVRLGEMLMPTVANGIDLDFDVAKDRSDNLEVQIKYRVHSAFAGAVRILAYQNHANMGSYQAAIDAALQVPGTIPDITAHRQKGRVKRGLGFNVVQELGGLSRGFARFGWNDGRNETFAYTEVDNTVAFGGDLRGSPWQRPDDKVGLAFVSNGISDVHREYLRLGGLGFLLGDGGLTYAREMIVEHYYNVHVWRGFFLAEGIQFIANPGYNSARGPVWVFSARGHIEF